jgi:hypothetical protein
MTKPSNASLVAKYFGPSFETLLTECEGLCHELGNRARLRQVLGQQARILRDSGDIPASVALLREKERL